MIPTQVGTSEDRRRLFEIKYTDSDFMVKVRDAVVSQIRYTFYKASGSNGRIGVSELFFIHPEATTPYASLMDTKSHLVVVAPSKLERMSVKVIGQYTGTYQCMSFRIPANDRKLGYPSHDSFESRLLAQRERLEKWRRQYYLNH